MATTVAVAEDEKYDGPHEEEEEEEEVDSSVVNLIVETLAQQTDDESDVNGMNLDNWFDDIVSGSASTKSRMEVLKEARSTMKTNNMWNRVFNKEFRSASSKLGKLIHRMNLSYPAKQELRRLDMSEQDNVQFMHDLKYALRHAMCSYGKRKLATRAREPKLAFHSTRTLLRDYYGIVAADIIIDNTRKNCKHYHSKLSSPRYYLVRDHKYKRIVLSIRGTQTWSDRITDVNAEPKPYKAHSIEGHVHEGILASTKFVFDDVTSEIIKQCKAYPNYELLVVGHSLGAGVASVLGLMYYQHPIIQLKNKLRVFGFGSPPVCCNTFVTQLELDYIFNVTLSTDFVTQLSLESVKQYNLRTDMVMNADQAVVDACINELDDIEQDEDAAVAETAKTKFLAQLKSIATPDPTKQLFPIGKCFWLVPSAVLEDNVVLRCKCLMGAAASDDASNDGNSQTPSSQSQSPPQQEEVETAETEQKQDQKGGAENGAAKKKCKFSAKWEQHKNAKAEKTRQKAQNSNRMKYGAHNYVLCEYETKNRNIFQQFAVDAPESFFCHIQCRYLWAAGTSIMGSGGQL